MVALLPLRHPRPLQNVKVPDLPKEPDLAEYDRVCQELGFRPYKDLDKTKKARHELLSFCLDHGHPIYDNREVHRWMIKRARNDAGSGYVYCWRAVSGNYNHLSERSCFLDHDINNGRLRPEPYKKPIPIEILKRAQEIKKNFPKALIYASDYEFVDPDPFIMVTLDGCEPIVFGAWDEPGFGLLGRDRETGTDSNE